MVKKPVFRFEITIIGFRNNLLFYNEFLLYVSKIVDVWKPIL